MRNNINKLIEEIIEKVRISDIVAEYVDIEKKGSNFNGLCPFHEDTIPSMSISDDKKIFKCFSCGVGGNVINFVQNFNEISFIDSLKIISEKSGIIDWRKYIETSAPIMVNEKI